MSTLSCIRILMMLMLESILGFTSPRTPAPGISTELLTFIDLVSQDFDNQWQVEEDERYGRPRHSHVQLSFIPCKVPALSSNYTVFQLELVDNKVYRQEVFDFTEDLDGTIRILRYNVTNTDKFSLDCIDLSGLQNLTPEDLEERKECEQTFSEIEPNVFFGLHPDCKHEHNGIIPQFTAVLSCSALSFFPPTNAHERHSTIPYILKSQGRFPLLPDMLAEVPNYTSPCPEI